MRLFLILALTCLFTEALLPCWSGPADFHGFHLIGSTTGDHHRSQNFLFAEQIDAFRLPVEAPKRYSGREANLIEWRGYFRKALSEEELEQLIYRVRLTDLRALQRKLPRSKSSEIPETVYQTLLAEHYNDFLNYLIYARELEPFMRFPHKNWNWTESDEKNRQLELRELATLEKRGRSAYEAVTDSFLKTRYAYQLVRVARYGEGDPEAAYRQYFEPLGNSKALVRPWAMAHVAGALIRSENEDDRARGHALLAEAFLLEQDREEMYYQSFRIRTQEEWDRTIAQATTNGQRAALHYLRAFGAEGNATEEMAAIYRLLPRAPFLDQLLLREIRKLEQLTLHHNIAELTLKPQVSEGLQAVSARAYASELTKLVGGINRASRRPATALWSAAEGYLHFLAGDYPSADRVLARVARQRVSPTLREQLELFRLALALSQTDRLSAALERRVEKALLNNRLYFESIRYFSDPDGPQTLGETLSLKEYYRNYEAYDYLSFKISSMLWDRGDYAKSYLYLMPLRNLLITPDERVLRDLIVLLERSDHTEMEKYLLRQPPGRKLWDSDRAREVLATELIRQKRFGEVEEVLAGLEGPGRVSVPDPFRSYLGGNASRRGPAVPTLTRSELARRIEALHTQERPMAKDYLARGNFYFNLSPYQPSWKAADHFLTVSGSNCPAPDSSVIVQAQRVRSPYLYPYVFNCDFDGYQQAEENLLLALRYARHPDRRAEVLLQLGHLQETIDRLNTDISYDIDEEEAPYTNQYYDWLAEAYGETDFFAQLVRECPRFDLY